jgi:hypothetical protein
MRVPQLNGVVDVKRTAEDKTFVRMPTDRIDAVDMMGKLSVESGNGTGFILA